MKRILVLLYGTVAYAIFLASLLYAVAWLGGFIVPKTKDSGGAASLGEAIVINLLLLSAFALQHSVMARPAFKRWWTASCRRPSSAAPSCSPRACCCSRSACNGGRCRRRCGARRAGRCRRCGR